MLFSLSLFTLAVLGFIEIFMNNLLYSMTIDYSIDDKATKKWNITRRCYLRRLKLETELGRSLRHKCIWEGPNNIFQS